MTLDEAKAWLRDQVDKGARCPCCTQYAKVYKRPLNGSMAYVLILLERRFQTQDGWLHVLTHLSEVTKPKAPGLAARLLKGDWTKLHHWGLIEEKPETRDDGAPHAGYHRITQLGRDFVHDRVRVPKYVWLYANRRLTGRTSPKTVSIHDVIGEKFSYRNLMEG